MDHIYSLNIRWDNSQAQYLNYKKNRYLLAFASIERINTRIIGVPRKYRLRWPLMPRIVRPINSHLFKKSQHYNKPSLHTQSLLNITLSSYIALPANTYKMHTLHKGSRPRASKRDTFVRHFIFYPTTRLTLSIYIQKLAVL